MEPIKRRSFDGMAMRRPQVAGAPAARPLRPVAHAGGPAPSHLTPIAPAPQPPHHNPASVQHAAQPHVPAAASAAQPSLFRAPSPANMDMRPVGPPAAANPQPQQAQAPRTGSFGSGTMQAGQPAAHSVAPDFLRPAQPPQIPTAAAPPQQSAHPQGAAIDKDTPAEHGHARKEPHPTAHAGLVGLGVFVVIAAFCFAPLLPGKIWHDAPGSSQTFSTGDQNLSCLDELGPVSSTETFDTKLGFPVTYNYSTTTRMRAECDGKSQTAIGGHTSQFNPIAVAIDFAIPLGLSIATAKLWRKFRSND